MLRNRLSLYPALVALAAGLFWVSPAEAQLFTNLRDLVHRAPVGPLERSFDGPKGVANADFDGDGNADVAVSNTDGSVTVLFGLGNGRFAPPLHLSTGGLNSLRGIVCADFNGDGRADIATAAPFQGQIFLFYNQGGRQFQAVTNLPAWVGVRNLAAGDFDGDGRMDLAAGGPKNGLRQYRNLGGGVFQEITNVTSVDFFFQEQDKFPKPLYTLKPLRIAGSARDQLIVTHAETNRVWTLAAGADGALAIQSSITNRFASHSLGIGPILSPTNSGVNDLIAVHRDAGILAIHPGLPGGAGFGQSFTTNILVPGGPRAIQMVDLNGDGWNDLIIVERNFDSVLTLVNSNGVLTVATERPAGTSPREMLAIDLDDDGTPDLAVMNRRSADLSILLAYPQQAGYRGVDHLYLVDGNVVGLAVQDFNHDGRDDVIQLHRASGDFSVRLSNADGTLGPPVFYTVGNIPAAQVFVDVNGDRIADQVNANLGTIGVEQGSVSVRLGRADGTFSSEQRYWLPAGVEGRLFALVPGDFDKDGNIDLAAGFLDSRIAFFQGHGDGTFTFTHQHPFVTQTRALVAGDFDGDGDLDLAGVGVSGEMWVLENRGDFFSNTTLTVQTFMPPTADSFGGRTIIAVTNDAGTDLDLIVGSGKGAWLYRGGPGMTFEPAPIALAGTADPVSDVLLADLDGDNSKELVIACRGQDCLSVFTRNIYGDYALAEVVDIPASRFIATGDLDGDGKPDLIGTGRILWTALSGHTNRDTAPLSLTGQRPRATNVVINEILVNNTIWPVESDKDRLVGWVELFNGTANTYPLGGWRIRSIAPATNGVPIINDFVFPTLSFAPGEHKLAYFTTSKKNSLESGFKLPVDGGALVLLNAAGTQIDQVDYPPQQDDISYARYRDGLPSFVYNPFPSPGQANPVNGLVEPDFHFTGVDLGNFLPGEPITFHATATADLGVSSVLMYYQRLDEPNLPVGQLQLQEVPGEDGAYVGVLQEGLPAGAEIQFYFEVTDLNDQTAEFPSEVEFGFPGEAGNAFQLAMPDVKPPIEISETVPYNFTTLTDETGGTPDWVELRNISPSPVSLDGIGLAHQVGDVSRFYFPTGSVLPPGGYVVVYCDKHPEQGALHAPISLSRHGDLIVLTGTTTNNSIVLYDSVEFGEFPPDQAYARLGAGGAWRRTVATPYICNMVEPWLTFATNNLFTLAFPTTTNTTYSVEHAPDLNPPVIWTAITTFPGDGIEKLIPEPMSSGGFYRVRRGP